MSSYVPYYPTWKDDPDHDTPIIAAALNNMEAGIALGVAAGGGGVDYKGTYDPGTAYAQGDVVVYNGVQYVCVNPGTGQTPPAPAVAQFQQAIPVGLALPSSPFDGQEFILCDAIGSYFWRLRYVDLKPSNKWVFIGGPAAMSEVATAENASSPGASYSACATPGPSVVVPVAGDYIVEFGCMFNDYANDVMRMSFDVGATGATDADSIIWYPNVGGVSHSGSCSRAVKKTGVPASAAITAKYKVANTSRSFASRFLTVTPIAVGG